MTDLHNSAEVILTTEIPYDWSAGEKFFGEHAEAPSEQGTGERVRARRDGPGGEVWRKSTARNRIPV